MSQNKKTVRIKELKLDLSSVPFQNPNTTHDGTNGKILEEAAKEQNFPVDSTGVTDLPQNVEMKTRNVDSNAAHTIGTMTYDNIINTPWDQTTFRQKMDTQYRVKIKTNPLTDEVTSKGEIYDMNHEMIQSELRKAYEDCRDQLIKQGKVIPKQTIRGGQFGMLEHKESNSYAWRIPEVGMRKIENMVILTENKLFDIK